MTIILPDYNKNLVLIPSTSQALAMSPPVRPEILLHTKIVTLCADLRKGEYKTPPPLPPSHRVSGPGPPSTAPIVRVGQKIMG